MVNRVVLPPSDAAAAWRTAAEPEKPRAYRELVQSIRETIAFTACSVSRKLEESVAVEIAQEKTLIILQHIESGHIEPGKETAYVHRCARHAALTHLKKQGRQVPLPDEELPAPAPSVERQIQDHEESEFLWRMVDQAPPKHRELLIKVYRDETPLEELVDREIEREGGSNDPVYRRRVRARIDNRLRLAREKLRDLIEQAGGLVRPPKGTGRK